MTTRAGAAHLRFCRLVAHDSERARSDSKDPGCVCVAPVLTVVTDEARVRGVDVTAAVTLSFGGVVANGCVMCIACSFSEVKIIMGLLRPSYKSPERTSAKLLSPWFTIRSCPVAPLVFSSTFRVAVWQLFCPPSENSWGASCRLVALGCGRSGWLPESTRWSVRPLTY
jgi:hypothetical protein